MNWSLKTKLVFWLGAGALTQPCLPTVSFAQLPAHPSTANSVRDIRPRHITSSDTRYIDNVEIKVQMRYGNAGVFDPARAQGKHRLEWKCAPVEAQATAAPTRSASVRSHYTITDLGTLGGSASGALAINDHGDVVGWADTTASKDGLHRHAFLWHNASMLDLGEGDANAINQKGQVVGKSDNKAFLYQDGKMHYLQTSDVNTGQKANNEVSHESSNQDRSNAVAINDQSQIVGWTAGEHALFSWVWQAGQVRRLPDVMVMDINNKGHMVGLWKSHPGVYDRWEMARSGNIGRRIRHCLVYQRRRRGIGRCGHPRTLRYGR